MAVPVQTNLLIRTLAIISAGAGSLYTVFAVSGLLEENW